MDKIKILIVDDHPMMRGALISALTEEDDLEVVGEAGDGQEALAQVAALQPNVVLMDLLMPGMDGLEATTRICETYPQVKILVITSMEDETRILAAIQAGAIGYFPKTAPRNYLLDAIRKVADGIPYLPGGIAAKLFKTLRAMKSPLSADAVHEEPLTARQREILALLGAGHSDKEIGKILHLEDATVRSHVHSILQRLNLETRAQVVAYANHFSQGV